MPPLPFAHDQPTPGSCSVFYGRKVKKRVLTRWGTHSLVTAVRNMVEEALVDPRNQRFMLMSGALPGLNQPALLAFMLLKDSDTALLLD